jgi:hypothetical protein
LLILKSDLCGASGRPVILRLSVTENTLAHPSESLTELSDVKNLVTRLYTSLHIEEHQLQREAQLLDRLHTIQAELQPMETVSAA